MSKSDINALEAELKAELNRYGTDLATFTDFSGVIRSNFQHSLPILFSERVTTMKQQQQQIQQQVEPQRRPQEQPHQQLQQQQQKHRPPEQHRRSPPPPQQLH